MELGDLVDQASTGPAVQEAVVDGDRTVDVRTVAFDSRRVDPGALFCCVPGLDADGHDFAAAAVGSGAVALVCERPLGLGVPEVRVPSVRAAMGPLAAVAAGRPSEHLAVVGFTGTNGKTTGTHLLVAILDAAGWPAAAIGTLTGTRTTPEAPDLQATLAGHLAGGARAVAMEVSSHALDQHRVDGTRFAVAVFTNLSRDHLDYHGDLASYFRAKARLFEADLSERAVVNLDDPHGSLLFDAATIPTVGYSSADATDVVLGAGGSRFTWRGQPVELPLAGRFNIANALAAATAAAELGIDEATIARGLAAAEVVAGRFELVSGAHPFSVVVDYAHTPDGLEHALRAARELAGPARVLVVFGCGGDRDRSKRPEMGRIGQELADEAILTTDNPRSEDPAAIASEVLAGVPDPAAVIREPDRAEAIALAIGHARPGDVVLIAGKGHETTQIIGDTTTAFDDRTVARQALAAEDHRASGASA